MIKFYLWNWIIFSYDLILFMGYAKCVDVDKTKEES